MKIIEEEEKTKFELEVEIGEEMVMKAMKKIMNEKKRNNDGIQKRRRKKR